MAPTATKAEDGAANGMTIQPCDSSPQSLRQTSLDLRTRIDKFLDEDHTDNKALRSLQGHVRVAMEVIGEALQRYGLDHLSLSYNGGKDCLALLILILACLPDLESLPQNGSTDAPAAAPSTLHSIYIVSKDPFDEVEDFVVRSTEQYHLDLRRYALPMREALDAYLEDRPEVKAIFMGTRRTDPHSDTLGHFSPTDKGWPQFMRVNPVIDWHYADIWAFIRHLKIPYCVLYDRGFTSLGGTSDTLPNPALAIDVSANLYRPAYELVRDEEERKGRVKK